MVDTKGLRVLLLVACLAAASPVQAQRVLFVDDDAATGGDGSSWQRAFRSLQDALAQSQTGDSVFVAEGRYTPDDGVGLTKGDRALSFEIKPGVSLFGGFRGTETYSTERTFGADSLAVYATVLSGDLAGNDTDGDSLFASTPSRQDNSAQVVRLLYAEPSSAWVRISGVVIEGGQASYKKSEVKVDGSHILHEGGGVVAKHACLSITSSVVRGNFAHRGGGLDATEWECMEMRYVRIEQNVAQEEGGGFRLGIPDRRIRNGRVEWGARGRWWHVSVIGNRASARSSYGGGGRLTRSVSVAWSVFRDNTAGIIGGGLYIDGNEDASPTDPSDDIVIVNTRIENNYAEVASSAIDCLNAGGLRMAGLLIDGNHVATSSSAYNTVTYGCIPIDAYLLTFRADEQRPSSNFVFSFNDVDRMRNTGVVMAARTPDTTSAVFASLERRPDVKLSFIYSVIEGPTGNVELDGTTALTPTLLGEDGTPETNSPAIDRVPVAMLPADWLDVDMDGDTLEALPLDLLGNPRVVGDAADAGAIERQEVVDATESEVPTSKNLRVWPSPAREAVQIESVEAVTVYNLLGRRVAVLPAGRHALDVQAWPAGTYFARSSGAVARFVVTR